jgi:hypothetical protein
MASSASSPTIRPSRWAWLLCAIAIWPTSASAQTVEVAGGLGAGFPQNDANLMTSGRFAVVWADRLETSLRATWFNRPEHSGITTYYIGSRESPQPVRIIVTLGDRSLLEGQLLYHYWRGATVRPFLGFGLSSVRDREVARCEVPGCELLRPGLPLGKETFTRTSFAGIVGGSGSLSSGLTVRGGIQVHCPVCEELSFVEAFVDIGYRFGGR